MKPSFKLFSVRGIDIGVHYSWFFIAVLIAWSLAEGFYPQLFPGWSEAVYWTTGIASAIALFASVLIHELAHSFVAQAYGIHVGGITLFLFGGVSNITEHSNRPRTELAITAVGPITSAVLGGVLWAVWLAVGPATLDDASPAQGMLLYLANINLLLAAFNLIPGFPLDGGRILHSIVWGATDNQRKATQVATWSGQIVGWGMIGFGVFLALSGGLLSGLWIAFIGWFLQGAANAGRLEYEVDELLGDVPVSRIMDREPKAVPPELDAERLVQEYFIQRNTRSALVGDQENPIGIVTLTDVHRHGNGTLQGRSVRELMTPAPLQTIRADEMVDDALKRLSEHDLHQLPVTEDDGHVIGMLSRETVLRYFEVMRSRRAA